MNYEQLRRRVVRSRTFAYTITELLERLHPHAPPEDSDWPTPRNRRDVIALLRRLPANLQAWCVWHAADLLLPHSWQTHLWDDSAAYASITAMMLAVRRDLETGTVAPNLFRWHDELDAIEARSGESFFIFFLQQVLQCVERPHERIISDAMDSAQTEFVLAHVPLHLQKLKLQSRHDATRTAFFELWWARCRCAMAVQDPREIFGL